MARKAKRRILDGVLNLLRAEGGGAVRPEAAAKEAGLSKPGLMYHFSTKEALMLGVVDHVADRWERLLLEQLGRPLETADAHYRTALTEAWVRRIEPWLTLPDDLPAAVRARLTAARLPADGYWTAAATGVFPVPARDRAELLAIEGLLAEGPAS